MNSFMRSQACACRRKMMAVRSAWSLCSSMGSEGRRKTFASRATLDELAGFLDGDQAMAILSENFYVRHRIAVDDQYIGATSRLNSAEQRLHQDLRIHGGRRSQNIHRRLHLSPDAELASLM